MYVGILVTIGKKKQVLLSHDANDEDDEHLDRVSFEVIEEELHFAFYVPSSISSFDFGTRFWSAFHSNIMHELFQSFFFWSDTD